MAELKAFFASVKLPTMPEVAHALIRTLNDEDVPLEKVRRTIARDPALTAKVTRLANSARFGLARTVSSVDEAITLTGLEQVRTLSLAACMSEAFPPLPGMDRQLFWRESMACAGFAQWLARTVGSDVQQSWLAGFMVRLGELIIAQHDPAHIKEIEQLPHHPGGRWEREARLLGFTEGQVSAELARRWNFPESIIRALETSYDPLASKPFCRLGGILHLATLLAEIGLEEDRTAEQTIDALPADVLRVLQLQPDWLKTHLPDVAQYADTSGL
ncbi:HDOD domain-containing protein [Leptospira sp. SA-E8]|uniref:HDOD domain-containing protein n=1 Tax=Leptospira sp. SA-E8 TaxID=3422259 RepID=UPI003EBAF6FC